MLCLTVVLMPLVMAGQTAPPVFFDEGFEDTKLASRGWYDGSRFILSDDAAAGRHAIQYHFAEGQADPLRLVGRPPRSSSRPRSSTCGST